MSAAGLLYVNVIELYTGYRNDKKAWYCELHNMELLVQVNSWKKYQTLQELLRAKIKLERQGSYPDQSPAQIHPYIGYLSLGICFGQAEETLWPLGESS